MIKSMKRLAIVSVFDASGYIYDYFVFFLKEICKIADEIYIIANGKLQKESYTKLCDFNSCKIYERENKGFDAAGYKYCFENTDIGDIINDFDEMMLLNDTCFGPLVSFERIFEVMEKKNLDFWGIDFFDNNLYYFLMSNFLVFSKKVINEVVDYFKTSISYDAEDKHEVCMKFERGLFRHLERKGYLFDSYVLHNSIDPYASPDILIERFSEPLLKKRGFFINKGKYNGNLMRAILLVKERQYPYEYILQYLKDKKIYTEEVFDEKTFISREIEYKLYNVTGLDMIKFAIRYSTVYIYGTGNLGQDIADFYSEEIENIKGFVVSDDMFVSQAVNQIPVYKISQVLSEKNVGIIVCMGEKNINELKKVYGYKDNFLYIE